MWGCGKISPISKKRYKLYISHFQIMWGWLLTVFNDDFLLISEIQILNSCWKKLLENK